MRRFHIVLITVLGGAICHTDGTFSACAGGVLLAGTLSVFTLPAGFRPSQTHVYPVLSYDANNGSKTCYTGRVDISPDGTVSLVGPPYVGYDFISFEGIDFRAGG